MNIPHYRDWRLHMHHITLLHQKLLRLRAYCFDDGLGEEVLLVEALYTLVEVDRS